LNTPCCLAALGCMLNTLETDTVVECSVIRHLIGEWSLEGKSRQVFVGIRRVFNKCVTLVSVFPVQCLDTLEQCINILVQFISVLWPYFCVSADRVIKKDDKFSVNIAVCSVYDIIMSLF